MIKSYLKIVSTLSKGRGVFTSRNIAAGTLIEESPVIVLGAEDKELINKTLLHDYIFEWEDPQNRPKNGKCCLALGYLSVYNHSYHSNCEYYMDFETETMQIKTVRDVKKGEELTINYNGDWNNEKPVWFETATDEN